jgi:raffinose/stachyose/melibiose transport system permease protein
LKKTLVSGLLKYSIVFFVMAVFIVPLFFTLTTSLKTYDEFMTEPVSLIFRPTYENFSNAFVKASFDKYIMNSLVYTIVGTVISLILSLLIAYPIARKYIRMSSGLLLFLTMGLFLPDGTIPLFQMFLKLGLYDTRLSYILSVLTIGGVPMVFFSTFIKGVHKELDEAAVMDGCGYFRCFFVIILPMCRPAISSMGILVAINIWNEITRSIVFLSSSKYFPITRGLFAFSGQYTTNWPELMAALIIVSLPITVLYVLLQKHIINGLTSGAVKM